ncbi:MAG: pantoate--beta-alanine ligase [Actinomycetota bacterium]|nr:pantoate--beta-alanine ligase [Actinomycetota bacterium]
MPSRLALSPVALVPTMGALHDGHRALLRAARDLGDVLVASIFVNPTQFGPEEDLERYPRDLERDLRICAREAVDLVYVPDVESIYPEGTHGGITVDPGELGLLFEGACRPTHFRGVLTVLAKLFGLVRPRYALFGEKDYQQLALIRAMVRDLAWQVEIVGVPTVREEDGLAMSSRNRYLDDVQRESAVALFEALQAGACHAEDGAAAVLAAAREVLGAADGVEFDYLVLTDPMLGPVPEHGEARLLVAATVGFTRLIDNVPIVLRGEPGHADG